MRRIKWITLITAFSLLALLLVGSGNTAKTYLSQSSIEQLQNEIEEYESQLEKLSEQANTLSNQISQFNAQIRLTELKIQETQERIALLGGRIDQLEVSLSALTEAFSTRASETYKMTRLGDPVIFLLSSPNLKQAVTRYRYLQKIQEADRELMVRLQEAQNVYTEEKTEQESLQEQLEEQQATLAQQKQQKANLLAVTRNDAARYQDLLDQAQRELEALAQSQFTGKKEVEEGDVIGLMGSTGFSTGPHLHFGYYNISEDEAPGIFSGTNWYFSRHTDPATALQARNLTFKKLSCNDVQTELNKPFGNGPFIWPMEDPYITQCYGNTPYSYAYPDNFHKGVDMSTKGTVLIKAIEGGVAYFYRGSSSFGNNVRVFHPNGKMSLYLHLQ